MKMKELIPTFDVPYYYSCYIPILHDKLKSMGSVSYMSLIANEELYSIPSYRMDTITSIPSVARYTQLLEYNQTFRMEKHVYSNFEKGLQYIKECLNRQEVFIALGSTFFLPYSNDYLNPKFIKSHIDVHTDKYVTDHYLAINKLTEDKVFVQDPVPNKFMGEISMEEFHSFWKGGKAIPELAQAKGIERISPYSSIDVIIQEKISMENLRDIFLRTLKKISSEYVRGLVMQKNNKIYYFGKIAALELKENINEDFHKQRNMFPLYLKCLFDMRWSRYFLYDLLIDMNELFEDKFIHVTSELMDIKQSWERLYKIANIKLLKKDSNLSDLESFNLIMMDIINRECVLHENILFLLQHNYSLQS
ncbi:hypothetical protein [Bacillus thuringiensis]|uniref:Uncharacterized protein n=1 Tax=Bacillus thuringiensis TaxID=1428 RepID=A0A9X7BN68_BACTU|nr:hypothetical protein COM82_30480 [Bacillus thuringiensis]PED27086.1 hypothetical protein CON34_06820 [Bacillus thuringiensis]PFV29611.1 hypothetical protein COK99_17120 [Bacillus thuringiensis]